MIATGPLVSGLTKFDTGQELRTEAGGSCIFDYSCSDAQQKDSRGDVSSQQDDNNFSREREYPPGQASAEVWLGGILKEIQHGRFAVDWNNTRPYTFMAVATGGGFERNP